MIRELDAREGWNTDFRSCAEWLSWRVNALEGEPTIASRSGSVRDQWRIRPATLAPAPGGHYSPGNYGSSYPRPYALFPGVRHMPRRTRIRPDRPVPAQASRPRARGQSPSPRQSQHGKVLRRLDPSLHPLPRQAPSRQHGRSRGHARPQFSGGRGPGGRLDPEPSAECAPVSLPPTSCIRICRGSTTSSGPSVRNTSPSF
jgi:hypothetical protein